MEEMSHLSVAETGSQVHQWCRNYTPRVCSPGSRVPPEPLHNGGRVASFQVLTCGLECAQSSDRHLGWSGEAIKGFLLQPLILQVLGRWTMRKKITNLWEWMRVIKGLGWDGALQVWYLNFLDGVHLEYRRQKNNMTQSVSGLWQDS